MARRGPKSECKNSEVLVAMNGPKKGKVPSAVKTSPISSAAKVFEVCFVHQALDASDLCCRKVFYVYTKAVCKLSKRRDPKNSQIDPHELQLCTKGAFPEGTRLFAFRPCATAFIKKFGRIRACET